MASVSEVQAIAGLVSAVIAWIFIQSWSYLAGCVYSLIPIVTALLALQIRKEKRAIEAEAEH